MQNDINNELLNAQPEDEYFLCAKEVTKSFDGFNVLDRLSLNIKKGSIYGLVGPNGAGKTTFIKALMGIYKLNGGEITLDGKTIYENEEVKQRIVYVCDDLFFYPTYTIEQTAKMYSEIYKNWSPELFDKLSDIYKIDKKRKIIRLSKGMQKQVAFWLGLSAQPDIMILDEPIDGLDPVMRRNTWKLVMNEVYERGMTVLVSSHNLRELEDVCDHVGIMFNGKMAIEKSLDDVKGSIHKIQLAFEPQQAESGIAALEQRLTVLHKSNMGSVFSVIIKGEEDEVDKTIRELCPIIYDVIPLTLEEVFIYELGGMGYEFSNILI